jgi:phenylalanyl-tRNA synthetase beta chain
VDVSQEADVVEEILRIYGFNNIELSEIVGADYLAEFPAKDPGKFKKSISEMLAGAGFQEILTNSLTNQAYQTKTGLVFEGQPVEMLNKLSEEQGILRQSMLFTGLEVCAHNINRKQKELRLFEFGKTYSTSPPGPLSKGEGVTLDESSSQNKKNEASTEANFSAKQNLGASAPLSFGEGLGVRFIEKEYLALYITGPFETENWMTKPRATQYHDAAQAVAHVLDKCNVKKLKQSKTTNPAFEYGMDLMRGQQRVGSLGKVKASICREMGIKQEVFYAELEAGVLFQNAFPDIKMKETARFPEVRRDLSLVIDASIKYEEIQALISATEKNLIADVLVFDVYEGDKIPQGKKAYALGFTLLNEQKTLTDEEIDQVMNRLINSFEQKLGAIIRK